MRKLILAAFAATALAMSWPAAAQVPQPYPPRACTVGTSGSILTPGEGFTVIVDCPGVTGPVTVTVPGVGDVPMSLNGQGQYTGTVLVPKSAAPGLLTITANAGGKVIGTTRANVVAPLSGSNGGKKSGGNASGGGGPWALVGATGGGLALLLGLGFFLKSRA